MLSKIIKKYAAHFYNTIIEQISTFVYELRSEPSGLRTIIISSGFC